MPSRKKHKHKTKSAEQKNKTKKALNLWHATIIALAFLLITIYELIAVGQSINFWIYFVISVIILIPNIFWLRTKIGTIFGLPFIMTMLKTKHFVNTINILGKHGKLVEKISIAGMFLGFGLTGIDYWVARKQGGIKRIIVLIIGAIILALVFYFFLQILFAVPALAPLLVLGLISFVLLGFAGLSLAFMLGYGFLSVQALIMGEQICPSIAPVLPGVPVPGFGVIIPLIAWVSLGLILVIHEASHGIMLSYYKEKIKSVGLIVFGIVPMGAFVEQDDATFAKRDEKKQLVVLSAGPTSNLVSIGIGLLILFIFYFFVGFVSPTINADFANLYDGLEVSQIPETFSICGVDYNSPAYGVLQEGDIILFANGLTAEERIKQTFVIENSLSLYSVFSGKNNSNEYPENYGMKILRDGVEMDLNISPVLIEFFNQKTIQPIGLEFIESGKSIQPLSEISWILILSIDKIIFFFIILSFAVGMFNFLPSDPLDGGRMAKIILLPYFSFIGFKKKEETQLFIGRLFVWLFLISILVNLLPYLTMFF